MARRRLDDLAISCIRARKIDPDDYASIPHLRVEIYPPHPEHPTDMVNTLRGIHNLCRSLRAIDRLQQVLIIFIENGFASWSIDGKLRMSMGWWQEELNDPDLEHVLLLFATVNNVIKATIQLPGSISEDLSIRDRSIEEFKAKHEQSMMNINLVDDDHVNWAVGDFEDELMENKLDMQRATRRKSLATIKEPGCFLISLHHFKKIWPPMESLSSEEIRRRRSEISMLLPW